MFSILIPTFNNLEYLKICINSLKKNSIFNHQIIVHVNEGIDGTLEYLNNKTIEFTHTKYNAAICEGVNIAFKKTRYDLIMYSHDDFYFCPNWDEIIFNEIKSLNHNKFYLSGSMISPNGYNSIDCGDSFKNFNEKKLLNEYLSLNINDYQGSSWAPHVIHRKYWEMVGGFSEEFFPGAGSDPDLNFKLWTKGIRIFKGLGKSKVYHFGSKTLRKDKNSYGSKSSKIFLLKWGISISFFKKYYLKSHSKYDGPLEKPRITIFYLINYLICRIKFYYLKLSKHKKFY